MNAERVMHTAVTAVSPRLDSEGWPFANVDPYPGAEVDPLYGASHMKDIYLRAEPNYNAKYAA